ncbi:MAG: alpha/beta hydrolase [Bacteroidota bacterium]
MPIVQIDSISLNYESIREVNAPDDCILVFLHEALGSIPQWRGFPAELCKKMSMNGIVYERQGHGKSDALSGIRPPSYLHDYAYIELAQLLEILLPPQLKIILVGHSDGGTIALLYASKFPKRVKAVITMAAHVIYEQETVAGIEPAIVAFEAGKLAKLSSFHGEKTRDLFYAWAHTWKNENFKNWTICNEIRSFSGPSLILQGKNDQYGTELQLQLIKENAAGDCTTLLLDACGHHPHLEQKEEVINLIYNWLSNKDPLCIR